MEKRDKLVLVGDGEFAEIAYEYFTHDSPYEVVAFGVEREYLKREERFGLPVVPFEKMADRYPPAEHKAFVAITSMQLNRARAQLYHATRAKGIGAPQGNLTFIEGGGEEDGTAGHIPFAIKRVYYFYDVPGCETRGGPGHKTLEQLIITVSGSFTLILDDGRERRRFFLNRSYYGLYIPPIFWRELEDFSSGSVCLVLASAHFDEGDYYRRYDDFLRAARGEER